MKLCLTARHVVGVCACLAGLGWHPAEAQPPPDRIVTIEAGELPIILSAPHGGQKKIPGVSARQGDGIDLFNPRTDSFTVQLTEKLADAIEQKLGKRPYVVIARFHRRYLDANRPNQLAYESDDAKTTYKTYHQALTNARREVIERWGHGLLLDIHGQAAEPNAIFRGTQNGKTTKHLVLRFGREALVGESSLFGQLAEQGLSVIPAIDRDDDENPHYDGGHIVRTYGSSRSGTLDAIQLELGIDLRSPQLNTATADKLANAIAAFADDYLPRVEQAAIHIGVYRDAGAGPSVNDLLSVLGKLQGVSVQSLTADDVRSGKLSGLDLLIHPGGSGGGQGRHLGEKGRKTIRDFVRDGGGFIGICAGAYLASADYTWSLNILDAKVLDRPHWNRGNGTVEIAITDAGRQWLSTEKRQSEIYYSQGPLLAPGGRPDIDDYEVMATYKTEIAKNGAPAGIMKGTTAIATGGFGRGRVVCFSPHPEMTKGLEPWVKLAIDHVKRDRSQQKSPAPIESTRSQSRVPLEPTAKLN